MSSDDWLAPLLRVPVAVWLLGGGLLLLGLWRIRLQRRVRRGPEDDDGEARLRALHRLLTDHAASHDGRLPAHPDELIQSVAAGTGSADWSGLTYRPWEGRPDPKLLIAHDSRPCRRVLEFPQVRPGRCVLFWSGKVRVVSESAFERLIEADDAFRARLAQR